MKINEIFTAIQGEGIDQGYLTTFIRLSGCNLRCSYCDTKYAYQKGKVMALLDIHNYILKHKLYTKRFCITGGEPFLHPNKVQQLAYSLISHYDCIVSIETNGTLHIPTILRHYPNIYIICDYKLPSSGAKVKFYPLNDGLYKGVYKFVIGNLEDYKKAKKIIQNPAFQGCEIHFSPVFEKKLIRNLAEWIIKDKLDVKYSLQIHKCIFPKRKRGV